MHATHLCVQDDLDDADRSGAAVANAVAFRRTLLRA